MRTTKVEVNVRRVGVFGFDEERDYTNWLQNFCAWKKVIAITQFHVPSRHPIYLDSVNVVTTIFYEADEEYEADAKSS